MDRQHKKPQAGEGGINKLIFSLGLKCQKSHLLWHQVSDQGRCPIPETQHLHKRSPGNKRGQNKLLISITRVLLTFWATLGAVCLCSSEDERIGWAGKGLNGNAALPGMAAGL